MSRSTISIEHVRLTADKPFDDFISRSRADSVISTRPYTRSLTTVSTRRR